MNKQPAIQIKGLSKNYGELVAVDNVSFDIKEGDFFGFLGPNGAGKTTTINSVVGLCNFGSGKIKVFGNDVVKDYKKARSYIGFAPQEFNFDRYLTIKEVLVFQAGYFGIPQKIAEARADKLLKQFNLVSKSDVNFTKLSGGMKRRLSLARALIHEPKILILDEPTAGMDVELRLTLWDLLRKMNKNGMTILLTTHYIEEAEKLCNRIGIIDKGKLVALDFKENLMRRLSKESVLIYLSSPVKKLPREFNKYKDLKLSEHKKCIEIYNIESKELNSILSILSKNNIKISDIKIEKKNLQDIFVEMTLGK